MNSADNISTALPWRVIFSSPPPPLPSHSTFPTALFFFLFFSLFSADFTGVYYNTSLDILLIAGRSLLLELLSLCFIGLRLLDLDEGCATLCPMQNNLNDFSVG